MTRSLSPCGLARWVGCAMFAVLCSSAVAANASPLYWSRAFVHPVAGGGGITQDTGQVIGTDTVGPLSANFVDGATGANSYASASVVDGMLHSLATAVGIGSTAGTAMAQYFDTFTPTSSTLAPGTPVSFAFDQQVSYTLAGNGCSAIGQVSANTGLNGAITSGTVRSFQDSTCDTSDSTAGSGIAQAFIGQEFVVQMTLFAIAGAGPGLGSADASFQLLVTPLGDFGFTTASGNTYQAMESSAVPEPGSVVLLAAGISAICGRRWHRLRRSRHSLGTRLTVECPRVRGLSLAS